MALNQILGSIGESVIKTPLAKKAVSAGTGLLGGGKALDSVSVSDGLLGSLGFAKKTSAKKTTTDFWSIALSTQKKFDQDKDGHLTDNEVEQALKRRDLSADQKAALETLRGKQEDLEELSNDEFGDENDGTTGKDLQALKNGKSQNARLMVEQFKIERGLLAYFLAPNQFRVFVNALIQ